MATAACTRPFFQPETGHRWTPSDLGLAYEDVWFESSDGTRLHGWLLRVGSAERAAPTIVFLHGNAENVSTHIGSVAWLPTHGFQVFLFDYRGFGLSGGTPDVPGALNDSEAALRLAPALPGTDAARIAVFGQSIGGALALCAAARVASEVPIRAVVVESAPSSWPDIAREVLERSPLLWAFARPLSWLVPKRPSPLDAARTLQGQSMLFIASSDDAIIGPHHAHRLVEAAGSRATLWEVAGVPHIGTFERPEWRARLVAHLKSVMAVADREPTVQSRAYRQRIRHIGLEFRGSSDSDRSPNAWTAVMPLPDQGRG